MARHTLSLNIPDTLNECSISIMDTSLYADGLPIDCPYLEILSPGFAAAVKLTMTPPFCVVNLTACDLGIQTRDCGIVPNSLPDGIYVIKYSVAPNEYVYVEYNHLRITNFLIEFDKRLCSLDLAACDPSPEIKETLKELRLIEMLVKAAKTKVEICHESSAGMDLYDYAKKRLSKLTCRTCN